jgi:hypothetical protein
MVRRKCALALEFMKGFYPVAFTSLVSFSKPLSCWFNVSYFSLMHGKGKYSHVNRKLGDRKVLVD